MQFIPRVFVLNDDEDFEPKEFDFWFEVRPGEFVLGNSWMDIATYLASTRDVVTQPLEAAMKLTPHMTLVEEA